MSEHGKALVEAFATGKLAASDIGHLAASAAASSSDVPSDVSRFSSAAPVAGTQHPAKNSARSLKRSLDAMNDSFDVEPYLVEMPFWDSKSGKQITDTTACLLIHEMLDELVATGSEHHWADVSEPSHEGLRADLHAWKDRVHLSTVLPVILLALWGDTGPFSTRDSLCLLTVKVLSGSQRVRLWLWAASKNQLCQCGCRARHTFEALWKVVSWSFQILLQGRYPASDHLGRPFPPGSRRALRANTPLRFLGACIQKCGDWMWYKQTLGLQGWTGKSPHQRCCWRCRATLGNCHQAGRDAPWRGTDVSMDEIASGDRSGGYVSGIFAIPGFTISSVRPDWMHVADLGIVQGFLGCVLWQLFSIELKGNFSNHLDPCGKLMMLLRMHARRLGVECPIGHLTIFMFRTKNSKRPKLRAKAAETRYLCPIILDMLQFSFPSDSAYASLRIHCLQALCDCYHTFSHWEGLPSTRLLGELARRHMVLLADLHTATGQPLLYQVQPKHHLFVHIAELAFTNPILEWCYGDESELGLAIRICSKMRRDHVLRQLLNRYILTRPFLCK